MEFIKKYIRNIRIYCIYKRMIESSEICVCCFSGENTKLCKDCNLFICETCVKTNKSVNFVLKKHNYCVECKDEICCFKKICERCDINPYHMITDRVAIGSCASNYKDFDIIVNLNYPENNVKNNDIRIEKIEKNKIMINVGLTDNQNQEKEAYILLRNIIPILYDKYSNNRILFHCYAGISRSAMFGIAYLSYSMNLNIEEAYKMIKEKRKFIEPNPGFLRALKKFEKE